MPRVEQLPESLHDFAYRNAVSVDSGQDFDVHMARLIRAMDRSLDVVDAELAAPEPVLDAGALLEPVIESVKPTLAAKPADGAAEQVTGAISGPMPSASTVTKAGHASESVEVHERPAERAGAWRFRVIGRRRSLEFRWPLPPS